MSIPLYWRQEWAKVPELQLFARVTDTSEEGNAFFENGIDHLPIPLPEWMPANYVVIVDNASAIVGRNDLKTVNSWPFRHRLYGLQKPEVDAACSRWLDLHAKQLRVFDDGEYYVGGNIIDQHRSAQLTDRYYREFTITLSVSRR